MDNNKQNTVLLTIIAVATLLIAVVGATFAYFTASNNQGSTAKVVTKSGVMKIDFSDGTDAIDAAIKKDIQPNSTQLLVNKTFTIKGTNITTATGTQDEPLVNPSSMTMPFEINMLYTTSFTRNELHVWLSQTKASTLAHVTMNGEDSTQSWAIEGYKDFPLAEAATETKLTLATGYFDSTPTDGAEIEFNLRMTFPDIGTAQDYNKNATFAGKLSIDNPKGSEVSA